MSNFNEPHQFLSQNTLHIRKKHRLFANLKIIMYLCSRFEKYGDASNRKART